jgi:hypothetical protein
VAPSGAAPDAFCRAPRRGGPRGAGGCRSRSHSHLPLNFAFHGAELRLSYRG